MKPEDIYARFGIGTQRVGFGNTPAILVIDMQRDFFDENASTGGVETAAHGPIAKLLEAARTAGVHVIYTQQGHRDDMADGPRWVDKFPGLKRGGLRTGSTGAQIVHELAPQQGDYVVEKRRPSGFFQTDLDLYLRSLGVDTVIVTGCTTSGCVRATAVDAFSYNYRVIVPRECVADRAPEPTEANLFDINMKYGDVLKLAEVLDYLKALKKS
ncbi:MAG: isochorismatase family protein [Candidatus Tectomicrobia bacterium]|nr:isochorismatase family protein [Candidatus Tectomicrobia bacterium]